MYYVLEHMQRHSRCSRCSMTFASFDLGLRAGTKLAEKEVVLG